MTGLGGLRTVKKPTEMLRNRIAVALAGAIVLTSPCVLHGAMPGAGPLTCLTPKGGRMPAFFPDGKRIAYVRPSADGAQQLHVLDLTTGESRRVGEIDDVERPAVSPDGKWIAYQWGPIFARRIWLVDPIEGAARPVTHRPGFHTRPCWVDSGKRLAFATGQGKAQTVVSVDPFTPGAKMRTHRHLAGGQPAFSASGKLAASQSVPRTRRRLTRGTNGPSLSRSPGVMAAVSSCCSSAWTGRTGST